MGDSGGRIDVQYTVTFTIPEERFGDAGPTREAAVGIAVEMLRRFTTDLISPDEVKVDPDDPSVVSANIWFRDEPSRPSVATRYDDALEAVCDNNRSGFNGSFECAGNSIKWNGLRSRLTRCNDAGSGACSKTLTLAKGE